MCGDLIAAVTLVVAHVAAIRLFSCMNPFVAKKISFLFLDKRAESASVLVEGAAAFRA